MAFNDKSLDDYVDVAQRIADFRELHPEGRLAPADPATPYEIKQVQGFDKDGNVIQQTFIVVVAAAYRSMGDTEPGVGMAWEVFPGRTPYTRGSELMNAETSAWGRAILAALASDSKKGVASRDEVRNRRAERDDGLPVNKDGSLSRSQTTTEEKEAAGVMTEFQQAEHSKLQPKRERGRSKRLNGTPPDDPFYDGSGPPLEPSEGVPGSASPDQLEKIGIRMSDAGITSRDARLTLVREIIRRPVESSKELSFTEAADVLKELARKPRETADA